MVAFDQGDVVMRNAHSAPAAPGDGFDHDWIANPFGRDDGFLFVFHDPF